MGTRALQTRLAAGPERPQPQWQQLATHQARVQTRPRPYVGEAPPPASPERAYEATVVDRTAIGTDGWRQALPAVTVYCTLTRTGDQWRVDQVDAALHAGPT